MPIDWVQLAIKIIPIVLDILRQLDEVIDQLETENRDVPNLDQPKRELKKLAPELQRIAQRINGTDLTAA